MQIIKKLEMQIKQKKLNFIQRNKKLRKINHNVSISAIVLEIDKIKQRLLNMTRFQTDKKTQKLHTPIKIKRPVSQLQISPRLNCENDCSFQSPLAKKQSYQINASQQSKKKKKHSEIHGQKKKISKRDQMQEQVLRLEEINKEFVRQNKLLQHRLSYQQNQKRQLQMVLDDPQFSTPICSSLIYSPKNRQSFQGIKTNKQALNILQPNIVYPGYRKSLKNTKQNIVQYQRHMSKDNELNKKNTNYYTGKISPPLMKAKELREVTFKEDDFLIRKVNQQSFISQDQEFRKLISKQEESRDSLKRQGQQEKLRLYKLQQDFSELIALSKNKHKQDKKSEIQAQLSEIANQIYILKSKVQIW